MSTAFIFPGQGSQSIGMGKDLYEKYDSVKEVFAEVDDTLNENLSKLIFDGDIKELTQTQNAQPAIMVTSIAILRAWEDEFDQTMTNVCDCVAGHSLGEYTALCAAGALSLSDTARLLKARGSSMAGAGIRNPGAMAAVLGLSMADVQDAAREGSTATEICVVANDNCPGQIVISGHIDAVKRAGEIATKKGAKRVIMLPVSGAFHSPLMQPAADEMKDILKSAFLGIPQIPVISNVTAMAETDPEKIKELLIRQITGTVRWTESVQHMITTRNITQFVECGPGSVLAGLVRKIDPSVTVFNLNSNDTVQKGF
jgi:[acyl-carrier-protein] S-malonyltransferase